MWQYLWFKVSCTVTVLYPVSLIGVTSVAPPLIAVDIKCFVVLVELFLFISAICSRRNMSDSIIAGEWRVESLLLRGQLWALGDFEKWVRANSILALQLELIQYRWLSRNAADVTRKESVVDLLCLLERDTLIHCLGSQAAAASSSPAVGPGAVGAGAELLLAVHPVSR